MTGPARYPLRLLVTNPTQRYQLSFAEACTLLLQGFDGVQARATARVAIRDSGIGIPEDALPRIFDRFYRAAPPDIEGTGLGLAIASRIAERNRFDLRVANRTDSRGVIAEILMPLSV